MKVADDQLAMFGAASGPDCLDQLSRRALPSKSHCRQELHLGTLAFSEIERNNPTGRAKLETLRTGDC